MSIKSESPPRIKGSGITVIDVYVAYARDGYEPAEIASAFSIPLADVHEALAHYYRHAETLRQYDHEGQAIESAVRNKQQQMVGGHDE
jgi:uncharacterized protein (DUF433 family)